MDIALVYPWSGYGFSKAEMTGVAAKRREKSDKFCPYQMVY
jgi:hypothetical protein